MQQSNVIFGALLVAFIVFVTMKGELPKYIELLRGGGEQPASTGASGGSGGSASSALNTIGTIATIAGFF